MRTLVLFFLSVVTVFVSCKNEPADKPQENTENTSTPKKEFETVKFKNHTAKAILLSANINIYDNQQKKTGTLGNPAMEEVEISAVSNKMYNTDRSTDYCETANFIKIVYKGQTYIVFGAEVYENNTTSIFSFKNTEGVAFNIFPATHFQMGASDKDGLTECDEYHVLVIKNEVTKTFSLIGYPENENIHNKKQLGKAVLFDDDGSEEAIYKVLVSGDTLSLGIKAVYQEGGSAFYLKTLFSKKFTKSFITDFRRYGYNEMDELENLR